MLLKREVLHGIAAGELAVAYRRWEEPRVRAGSSFRTAVGVIEVVAIREVDRDDVGEDDARAAGFGDVGALLAADQGRSGRLYRIELSYAGPDPRVALRARPVDDGEFADIVLRFDCEDTRRPWTHETLRLIGRHPGVRAEELAASAGREKKPFKLDVRKLKDLGLTESLRVGYRLSPRGESVAERLGLMG